MNQLCRKASVAYFLQASQDLELFMPPLLWPWVPGRELGLVPAHPPERCHPSSPWSEHSNEGAAKPNQTHAG